jgi:hypothetical protein
MLVMVPLILAVTVGGMIALCLLGLVSGWAIQESFH